MSNKCVFKCPVCGGVLNGIENTLFCDNNHVFDRAKEGYVNLLSGGGRAGKIHGDSPDMVIARRDFLQAGYYQSLKEALYSEVTSVTDATSVFLDACCGEGYYTNKFNNVFDTAIALDISKDAVRRASKGGKNINYAVASVFSMPVFDGTVDCITSVFAPYSSDEFSRILKDGGYVFAVVPGAEHLWGMKEILYEKPYLNDEKGYDLPGFELCKKTYVDQTITVLGQHIESLFKMTPYYWKSPSELSKKLLEQENLETKISFVIYCYKKNIKR